MNNKGADQTARMCRLICTFVVRIWHKQVFSWGGSFDAVWSKVPTITMLSTLIQKSHYNDYAVVPSNIWIMKECKCQLCRSHQWNSSSIPVPCFRSGCVWRKQFNKLGFRMAGAWCAGWGDEWFLIRVSVLLFLSFAIINFVEWASCRHLAKTSKYSLSINVYSF